MGGQMGGGGMGGSVGSNGSSRAHTPPPVAAGAGYRGWRLPAGTVWVEAEEQLEALGGSWAECEIRRLACDYTVPKNMLRARKQNDSYQKGETTIDVLRTHARVHAPYDAQIDER